MPLNISTLQLPNPRGADISSSGTVAVAGGPLPCSIRVFESGDLTSPGATVPVAGEARDVAWIGQELALLYGDAQRVVRRGDRVVARLPAPLGIHEMVANDGGQVVVRGDHNIALIDTNGGNCAILELPHGGRTSAAAIARNAPVAVISGLEKGAAQILGGAARCDLVSGERAEARSSTGHALSFISGLHR